jgi:RND family efflux transporter MFP subunit
MKRQVQLLNTSSNTLKAVVTLLLCAGASLGQAEPPAALSGVGLVVPYRQVELATISDGVINEIVVKEGDSIQEGQILVKLDSRRETFETDYTKFLMEKRTADLEAAQTLFKEQNISQEEFRQKQIESKLAETQYRISQQKLEEKFIRAPFSGLVVRRFKEQGESVHSLERVIQIVNLDKVYITVYLEGANIVRARKVRQAKVTIPICGDEVMTGAVESVDPVIDPGSGMFRVKICVENADRRIPSGTKAQVTLLEEEPHAAATAK